MAVRHSLPPLPNDALNAAPNLGLPRELAYLVLLFALFVVPKWLQRYRIPAAITSLGLGVAATFGGWFTGDTTVQLLASFGIVALFLFAGLDIDADELRRAAGPLAVHGLIWILLVALATAFAQWAFRLPFRPAILVSLALVTPSTGFILSSLSSFGLDATEQFAVKSKGVAAQRFRAHMPAMSSEKMVEALEAFGSVFIPFYFFSAGTHVDRNELGVAAIGLGLAFVAAFVPLRIAVTYAHRRWMLGDSPESAKRIAVSLVPTLVFTLVLAEILRERFAASHLLVGALIVYTIVNTTVPAFVLRASPPDFETPLATSHGASEDAGRVTGALPAAAARPDAEAGGTTASRGA